MNYLLFGAFAIWVAVANGNAVPQDDAKVIGGTNTKQGDFPFVVSVHQETNFLCVGVLVDIYWVLTSAICISDEQTKPLKVSVGGVKYADTEVGRYDINVAAVEVHEEFYSCNGGVGGLSKPRVDSYYYCNNLALLRLSTPAIPNIMVQPITLTEPIEITLPGTIARFAGWGGTSNASPSAILQVSNAFQTMDTVICSAAVGITMTDLDLCTVKTTDDACEFDQGGPLFKLDISRGYVLIGIVNYAPCGSGLPIVYASATGQRWWIKKITGV